MRVKEIEYGELKTKDYNNYKVSMRVELDEGEDPDEALEKLKSKVRKKLAEAITEQDPYYNYLEQEVEKLRDEVSTLREQKEQLMKEIIDKLRYKFSEVFR